MLRWIDEPAMNDNGHSHAIIQIPMIKLMICNVGNGFTAGSSVLVAKSQKIFGQKKPSIAAAIWSDVVVSNMLVEVVVVFPQSPMKVLLTSSRGQDNEPRPVILDKPAHFAFPAAKFQALSLTSSFLIADCSLFFHSKFERLEQFPPASNR